MTDNTTLVDMGYVAGAFGIKGWVKIKVATEYADSLADYENISLKLPSGQTVSQTIESGFARDGVYHAKFSGINSRDAAVALRGAVVAVARDEFPDTDEDEYYWVDLIGMQVVNLQGEILGAVSELMETGANDVLVIGAGKDQRLVPFVAQYIVNVDMATKTITADWGLDY